MKIKSLLYALTVAVFTSSLYAAAPLKTQVIVGTPEGFLVTSTLVTGAKDAVLIDGQFTVNDAKRVVMAIKESKKNLTTVIVTHAHPDHYFGLNVIRKEFPKAQVVALPVVVDQINKTWEKKVNQWRPKYGEQLPERPVIPMALTGSSVKLEGATLEMTGPVQGDDSFNSYVWIPAIKTLVTGDIVYNGVYPWTAETTPELRKEWSKTIDKLLSVGAETVIAGHKTEGRADNNEALTFTKEYLLVFDTAIANTKNAEQLIGEMEVKYPNLALDVILKIGAEAAFAKK